MMFPETFPNKQILDSSLGQSDNTIMETHDMAIAMSTNSVWESERGIFIRVIVKPNSKSKEFISERTPEFIHLNLSGPAREGKANIELIKKMARELGITTSAITLVSGHKNREKIVLVRGITKEIVLEKLSVMI
ncbi:MAG: DUF167 domain-containing protein [Candidatus Odinarchaeota archaeon]